MGDEDRSGRGGRLYRLAPLDRTGWMFGLGLAQLAVCASGVVAGVVVMSAGQAVAGVVVVVVAGVVGVARVGDRSLIEAFPGLVGWLVAGVRGPSGWYAPVPLVGGGAVGAPGVLADLDVVVVDGADHGPGPGGGRVAVSRDRRAGTYAVTVRVAGRQFALVDRAEQDQLVGQWGVALQGFVAERSPVVSVRWTQWAAPTGLDEHRRWVADHLADHPLDDVRVAYERLLARAGGVVTRHETLVTVTVHPVRGRVGRRGRGDLVRVGVEAALGEVRLLTQRLEAAGLSVSPPLSPGEWARAVRVRLDPSARPGLDGRRRALGDPGAGVSLDNALPQATVAEWKGWRTDGVWHRGLVVAEWPRFDVTAGWLGELMAYAGAVRSVTVGFEPVPRSRSRRAITRHAARIHADAEHRAGRGVRVGAGHRRAARAVEEREEELVAGYAELTYAGVVTVTAATLDDLDDVTAEITQIAASVGIELRPLHGRHDQAVCVSLPVARGFAPPRWQP